MNTIQIHLKSFDKNQLKKFSLFMDQKFGFLSKKQSINVSKTYKKIYTVIRSPHVHKKSREQFELTEYHQMILFKSPKIQLFLYILQSCNFYGLQIKLSLKSKAYWF